MRTVLSLVLLAALLWASCTVKLGAFTLAEHVDRIGETDEAKALLDGTRGKIAPVLEDMKQRVFGEYVEAPTAPPKAPSRAKGERAASGTERAERKGAEPAKPPAERRASSPVREEPKLPARAAVGSPAQGSSEASPGSTPARPTRGPSTSEAARLPGARRPD